MERARRTIIKNKQSSCHEKQYDEKSVAPVFHRGPGVPGLAGICAGRGRGEERSFQGMDDEGDFSGGSRKDLRGPGASGHGKGGRQDQHRGAGRPQFPESGPDQGPGAPRERHHRRVQYGLTAASGPGRRTTSVPRRSTVFPTLPGWTSWTRRESSPSR